MEKKGWGEMRRNNGGIIGSRRGERESLGRQSNPRIKRLIRRKPVDFPPRVHLVVGQRRRGKGGELYSERACTSFERSKSINSSPSTFLFFLFFFPLLAHDNRPRLAYRPSPDRRVITYGILYEPRRERIAFRPSRKIPCEHAGLTLFRDDPIELRRVNEKRWKWRVDTDPFALELAPLTTISKDGR